MPFRILNNWTDDKSKSGVNAASHLPASPGGEEKQALPSAPSVLYSKYTSGFAWPLLFMTMNTGFQLAVIPLVL